MLCLMTMGWPSSETAATDRSEVVIFSPSLISSFSLSTVQHNVRHCIVYTVVHQIAILLTSLSTFVYSVCTRTDNLSRKLFLGVPSEPALCRVSVLTPIGSHLGDRINPYMCVGLYCPHYPLGHMFQSEFRRDFRSMVPQEGGPV